MKTVIIVGCGFGGIEAALHIKRSLQEDVRVIALDQKKHHTFYGAMFEIISERYIPADVHTYLIDLFLRNNIEFYPDAVTAIDTAQRRVSAGQQDFNYDYLIINLGSVTNFFGVEGAEQFALRAKTAEDAETIRQRLHGIFKSHFESRTPAASKEYSAVMIGGGLSGIEVVCEMRFLIRRLCIKYGVPQSLTKVYLLEASDHVMPGFPLRAQQKVEKYLSDIEVTCMTRAKVTRVDADSVHLDSGVVVNASTIVWAAGIRANPLCERIGLPVDKSGAIVVNEFLQSVQDKNVFVIGDCASLTVGGKSIPKTAVVSIEQGVHAAKNIVRMVRDKKPKKFAVRRKYELIVHLGNRNALYTKGRWSWLGYIPFLIKRRQGEKYLARYRNKELSS